MVISKTGLTLLQIQDRDRDMPLNLVSAASYVTPHDSSSHADPWLEHFARRLPGADFRDGILNLGDGGIHFVGSELRNSKLWIRPCYEHLTDLIREKICDGSKSRFIIIGSPGVGKTTYSYVWLYDLAFESQRVVYQYNTNVRYLFDWTSVPFVRSGSGDAFIDELMETRTWFLIDGRANLGGEPMRFNAKCILFSCSPNPQEYYQFAKPRDALKLYMPVWSESEVLTCRSKLHREKHEKEVLGRFQTYGGLARYMFDKSNVECIVDFKEAMDSLSTFDKIFDAVGGSPNPLLYLLLHFFNVKDDNFQYYGFRVEFGSQFLANEVLANLVPLNEGQILTWVDAGVNDIFGGVRRQIRQYYFQKEMSPARIKGGDGYSTRSSCSPESPASGPKSSKLITYKDLSDSESLERDTREKADKLERELKKERMKRERDARTRLAKRRVNLERERGEMERLRRDKERLDKEEIARLKSERDRLGKEIDILERKRTK